MDSLIEEASVVPILYPATRTSVATGDYVSMKNYDKVTFIIQAGSITAGTNIVVNEAKTVAGGSATALDFDYYYKVSGASDTYTKTSADSSTSLGCITVGNSSSSVQFMIQIGAEELSNSFDCLTLYSNDASHNGDLAAVAVCHKARYQQAVPPTAITD